MVRKQKFKYWFKIVDYGKKELIIEEIDWKEVPFLIWEKFGCRWSRGAGSYGGFPELLELMKKNLTIAERKLKLKKLLEE